MKTPFLFTAFLFILIITSCDECTIFPPVSNYELGDTLWIHELPGKDSLFIYHSLALGKNNTLYYAAAGGTVHWTPLRVFALDTDDGNVKWISGPMDGSGAPGQDHEIVIGDDGTVYIIGYHTLYAIDPGSGAFKWKWEVPKTVTHQNGTAYTYGQIGALALTDEGDLILGSIGAGVYSRALFGIDQTGMTKFVNLDANGVGIKSGIYIGKNNTAYYYSELSGKQYLVSANSNTGVMGWKTEIGSHGASSNNIVLLEDGNLFCAFYKAGENKLKNHIVNSTNGNILWSGNFDSQNGLKFSGPDARLYVNLGYIYEVDKNNDKLTQIVSANLGAISENNRIVTAFTDADFKRKLGVFYPDGLLDFSVPMEGLEGSDLVISEEKVVFGIIWPHKICAVQGNSKLAKKGWPRPKHDNRNTGNAAKY